MPSLIFLIPTFQARKSRFRIKIFESEFSVRFQMSSVQNIFLTEEIFRLCCNMAIEATATFRYRVPVAGFGDRVPVAGGFVGAELAGFEPKQLELVEGKVERQSTVPVLRPVRPVC